VRINIICLYGVFDHRETILGEGKRTSEGPQLGRMGLGGKMSAREGDRVFWGRGLGDEKGEKMIANKRKKRLWRGLSNLSNQRG